MADSKEKIYLVDGSGYIFRAYFATPPLTNSDGFPTNALYAFTRMLIKLLNEAASEHIVMVFDAGRETFRTELYKEYKANRDECPKDLAPQMPYFREIPKAFGIPVLELAGFEADDLIATLTASCKSFDLETVIVSADKDLMQLISPGVSMWDTMRDKRYGAEQVQEKFGVPPEKVVEYLALAGDSSDNIPGLRGAGPKTAALLIELFGDVENMLNNRSQILEDKRIRSRKKLFETINNEEELIRISRTLVEVRPDVPLEFEFDDSTRAIDELSKDDFLRAIVKRAPDNELFSELITRFEFSSLVKDLKKNSPGSRLQESAQYSPIYAEDFKGWLADFSREPLFSFDLETTSLDVLKAEIVGIAICWKSTESFYIPFAHQGELPDGKTQLTFESFLASTKEIFSSPEIKKVGQNLKYDIGILEQHGVEFNGAFFDTMIGAYLLNPDRGSVSLAALAHEFLGVQVSEFKELSAEDDDFRTVSVPDAVAYAAEDAHAAFLLFELLHKQILEQKLERVMIEIEMPLVQVLSRMERRGVLLDTEFLAEMSEQLEVQLEKIRSQVFELAGMEFNMNSPQQLGKVLFEKLGLSTKGIKKTKTGYSTNHAVLEKIRNQHPLPAHLLDYRMLNKLKTTYVDSLPQQVSPISKRLHTRYNQTVTATGRLSSSQPNLQNIPIQTEQGRLIRKAFIAPGGKLLMAADYSQIELRLLAHLSGDEELCQAFIDNTDIHEKTAREILSLGTDQEVTSTQRRLGKTINFGIIYGMSHYRLSRELDIPLFVAKQYIEDYFGNYPKVAEYFDSLERQAEEHGFVTTIFGRRRFVSQIDSAGRDGGFLKRAALNAPIQGSAADLIKLAMINIEREIQSRELPLEMIMQIHDELVFEVLEDHIEPMQKVVQELMERVIELKVPLRVDISSGPSWNEAH